jgi:nitrile hydratase subunit beta
MMLLTPDLVPTICASGQSARLEEKVAPRFKTGAKVRVRNLQPTTHTRLPGYLRGKVGTVEIDHGVFIFPDTHAHSLSEKPQHCYCVSFKATDVWGPGAAAKDTLRVDLFDDYLDPA